MKNISKLMVRLQRIMPKNIKPAFKNSEELLIWHEEQNRIHSANIRKKNHAIKLRHILNRSGIRPLYQNCSFKNYKVECQAQLHALNQARQYVEEFNNSIASFIFSGRPGTGKNHLAAAICNELLLLNKTVLIITVADIMSTMKVTFNNDKLNEEQLVSYLSNVDLLVIDEIGVQIESRYEKVIINQIVDRRSSFKYPTGMLTNYNIDEMTKLLGERIIDRMKLGDGLYVIFDWDSYRSRVTREKLNFQ